MTSGRLPSRIALAGIAGGLPTLGLHAWLAFEGRFATLAPVTNGHFYEVQARSLLHGRWDIPADSIGAERFRVGDRFYEYFGPWPAIIRMPVVAVTDRLDGRLSRITMLLAVAVFLAALTHLVWQARLIAAPGTTWGRRDVAAVALFVLLGGCATPLVFISSWTAVYHEAIAWGVAWSVVSATLLVAHLRTDCSRALVGAGVAAALALLSRGSVGLGPVAALATVLVVRLIRRDRRVLALLAATVAVPIALTVYVNWAKFGTLSGIPPTERQDLLTTWPSRGPAMAANDGSLFGPRYAATIALQYARPDAIGFDRLFPWVTFSRPPRIVGGAVFEAVNPSVSVSASSPLFIALGTIGVLVIVRRRLWPLAPGVVGGTVGCVGAFSLAFIDQRYQGDLVPALVVAAVAAWWPLVGLLTSRAFWAPVVGGLAVWSCWVNGAIAYQYQRGWSMDATTASRARMVTAQLAVHDAVSTGPPSRVTRGGAPPSPGRPHSLFVQGDCDAVHWADGREWHPVEATEKTGTFTVRLQATSIDMRMPLVIVEDERGSSILWVLPGGRRVEYEWRPRSGTPMIVPQVAAAAGSGSLDVRLERLGAFVSRVHVSRGDHVVIDAAAPVALGAPKVNERLAGDVAVIGPNTPICDRLERLGAKGS